MILMRTAPPAKSRAVFFCGLSRRAMDRSLRSSVSTLHLDLGFASDEAGELLQPILQAVACKIGEIARHGQNHFGFHAGNRRARQNIAHRTGNDRADPYGGGKDPCLIKEARRDKGSYLRAYVLVEAEITVGGGQSEE